MLVYGTLSGDPLQLSQRALIGGKRVEGFYLGRFMLGLGIPRSIMLFREISKMIRNGVLATELGESFPLDRVAEAARASEVVGKKGKILIKIG